MAVNIHKYRLGITLLFSTYLYLLLNLYPHQDLYLRKKPPNPCHSALSTRCVGITLFRPLINVAGRDLAASNYGPGGDLFQRWKPGYQKSLLCHFGENSELKNMIDGLILFQNQERLHKTVNLWPAALRRRALWQR